MMKTYINLLILAFAVLSFNAGQSKAAVIPLQFNSRFTRCENRWVAMPLQNNMNKYAFGIVYIEPATGFIFKLEGTFSVDAQDHFVKDADTHEKTIVLNGSGQLFAILDSYRADELGLQPNPARLIATNK